MIRKQRIYLIDRRFVLLKSGWDAVFICLWCCLALLGCDETCGKFRFFL